MTREFTRRFAYIRKGRLTVHVIWTQGISVFWSPTPRQMYTVGASWRGWAWQAWENGFTRGVAFGPFVIAVSEC